MSGVGWQQAICSLDAAGRGKQEHEHGERTHGCQVGAVLVGGVCQVTVQICDATLLDCYCTCDSVKCRNARIREHRSAGSARFAGVRFGRRWTFVVLGSSGSEVGAGRIPMALTALAPSTATSAKHWASPLASHSSQHITLPHHIKHYSLWLLLTQLSTPATQILCLSPRDRNAQCHGSVSTSVHHHQSTTRDHHTMMPTMKGRKKSPGPVVYMKNPPAMSSPKSTRRPGGRRPNRS
jgi:hypothetical protein